MIIVCWWQFYKSAERLYLATVKSRTASQFYVTTHLVQSLAISAADVFRIFCTL